MLPARAHCVSRSICRQFPAPTTRDVFPQTSRHLFPSSIAVFPVASRHVFGRISSYFRSHLDMFSVASRHVSGATSRRVFWHISSCLVFPHRLSKISPTHFHTFPLRHLNTFSTTAAPVKCLFQTIAIPNSIECHAGQADALLSAFALSEACVLNVSVGK